MIFARWLRFGWDLKLLHAKRVAVILPHYFRRANKTDHCRVSVPHFGSQALDADRTDWVREIRSPSEGVFEFFFEEGTIRYFMVAPGRKIAIASRDNSSCESPMHLARDLGTHGENCDRLFGSALVHRSIHFLKGNGKGCTCEIMRAGCAKFDLNYKPTVTERLAANAQENNRKP